MKLPTKEECFEILKENNVPSNVIEHCKAVNKLAVFLAKRLKQSGVNVDVDIVDRASLLHDLDRANSKNHSHGYVSENILTKKGYPELGKTVVKHRFLEILNKNLSWEEKIINYADKRITNTRLVSLKERFEELIKRHIIKPEQRSPEAERAFFDLENDIFKRISIKPEELKNRIK